MAIEHFWNESTSKQRIPAWAMSAALHTVVLIMLAVFWKNYQPSASGASESSRTAGIMVAVTSNGETEYFDESNSPTASEPQAVSGASPATPADALPSVEQLPELADIALPGVASTQGAVSGNLLDGPDLGLSGTGLPQGDIAAEVARTQAEEAANRPPPPIGTPANLTVFGAPSVGRSFVFTIDRSKSMGGSGLGALLAAERELLAGLSTLTESQRFEIVAYHQSTVTFGQTHFERSGLVRVTDESRAEAKKFFEGLVAFGGTKHHYGIFAALDMKPEVIFLLTDGSDPPTPSQMKRIIGQAKRQGTVINSVQFGLSVQQERDNFMMQLAQATGGVYRYHRMR